MARTYNQGLVISFINFNDFLDCKLIFCLLFNPDSREGERSNRLKWKV